MWIDIVPPNIYQVAIHNNCQHNEVVALYNRHLIDRAQPTFDTKFCRHWARKLWPDSPRLSRVSYAAVWSNYRGGKRARYIRAAEWLYENELTPKHAYVTMFVKPDKYPSAEIQLKAPRAIQYRSTEYTLELASYLKPIEEWIYENLGERDIVKGLNNQQKAENLMSKWEQFDDPVAILADHSKFDSCQNEHLLKIIHKIYMKFNKSKRLRKLLLMKINNKGYTGHGIKYKIRGTGMSGDFDTALRNCVLNWLILRSYFGKNAGYLVDGDDSVVIIENRRWRQLRKGFLQHARKWNMTTTFEVVHELHAITFCQMGLLDTGMFVREPVRALSHFCVALKYYQGKARWAYLAGKAEGLFHVSQRTPVLYAFFQAYMQISRRKIYDDDTRQHLKHELLGPPCLADRESYAKVYGITVQQQLQWESDLVAWVEKRVVVDLADYYAAEESTDECATRDPALIQGAE